MAKNFIQLTEVTDIANNDIFAVVDVSDTAQSAQGSTRKATKQNMLKEVVQSVSDVAGSVSNLQDYVDDEIIDAKAELTDYVDTKYSCRVTLSANQSYGDNSSAKVQLDTKTFDIGSNFNTVTHRYIAPVEGIYYVSARLLWGSGNTAVRLHHLTLRKNNVEIAQDRIVSVNNTSQFTNRVFELVSLDKDDYIELFGYQNSGDSKNAIGTSIGTMMEVHLVQRT